jgi:hypothetical protein
MLIIDESTVKVGGVILPGIFKSFEIKGSAKVEEVDVKGRSTKPKQATGYSDAKLNLEIRLLDDDNKTALEKLKTIQALFKKSGQKKPTVHEIVSEHTSVRGITKVIFKDLTTKEKSDKSEMSVSLEFWEYIPITITATKSSSGNASSSSKKKTTSNAEINLNDDYKSYLPSRGKAPRIQDKTSASPAVDDYSVDMYSYRMRRGNVPY